MITHMALTKDFRDTVQARAIRDPGFRQALLVEGAGAVLNGETDTAKSLLRDLINATVGFEALGSALGKSSKSLHRMLSVNGNPTLENLSQILNYLQKQECVALTVHAETEKQH